MVPLRRKLHADVMDTAAPVTMPTTEAPYTEETTTEADAVPPDLLRKPWTVLAIALAAQVLVVLDISVVNTALPTIGRSLDLRGTDLQWLVTAYLVMSGGGLLLGGRIADVFP